MDIYAELLNEHGKEINMEININKFDLYSEEQAKVIKTIFKGENICMIGAGGVGKSKVIQDLKSFTELKTKRVYITSTTGISAYNINGITINSYLNIKDLSINKDELLQIILSKTKICSRIKNTDILIIDEISMLSADMFETIEYILRMVKKNNKIFGGIQIVLSGDFLQLQPIFKESQNKKLLFESNIFKKFKIIIMKKNFRQNNCKFYDILNEIRFGNIKDDSLEYLNKRIINKKDSHVNLENSIYLVATIKESTQINNKNLENNTNDSKIFNAKFKIKKESEQDFGKIVLNDLKNQFRQKNIESITLKKNCKVMLLKNIDVESGIVNGSIGFIKDFINDKILVEFDKKTISIGEMEWELNINNTIVTAFQIPLIPAYAINIHKSMGLTLNTTILDISKVFCESQIYVALSRIKNIEGLFLIKEIKKEMIYANHKCVDFIQKYTK